MAIIDNNNKILDINYYSVERKFRKNFEVNILIETEINKTVVIESKLINPDLTIVIGFMIDEKRSKILN